MRALIKEPLTHMLIIGGALFILDTLVQEQSVDRNKIVITEDRIEHLSAVFSRRWQRAPSPVEVQQLVETYVREEILYREALNLGLDHNDTVIRRRLRMKIELAARDIADNVEPAESTLQQYMEQNGKDYQRQAHFSFRQLYFQTSNSQEDIKKVLIRLNQGLEDASAGDSSLLPNQINNKSSTRIDQLFGPGFSSQLTKSSQGNWFGPLKSAYGWHLVFVDDYEPSSAAKFSEVRTQVLRDWQLNRRKAQLEQQYQQYRENYTVRIDAPSL
ncbi:peptidyl-prolyl cis-trans isomerase [Microbulbifer sp. SSSA007]|uniref:peptidyl-prolyl cis-trans isomerase n=1 Tax=unclassified Microbulbifer TaxID=2619833 RepID=UPI004039E1FF